LGEGIYSTRNRKSSYGARYPKKPEIQFSTTIWQGVGLCSLIYNPLLNQHSVFGRPNIRTLIIGVDFGEFSPEIQDN